FGKVTHDISDRRRMEERLRRIVESAPNAMVIINQAGLVEMVNVQTERVFGYTRDELLGKPMEMLVPERFRSHHPGLRKSFHADPRSRPMGAGRDLYGLRKDGTEVPIEIGLTPIETDEGLMVLSAIVDISERKRREEQSHAALKEKEALLQEIQAAHRKLEGEMVERLKAEQALRQSQKMEAVGQLTGGIAHDFNNMLTVVGSGLELIGANPDDPARVARWANGAMLAVDRCTRLVEHLLMFSRRQMLHPEIVNLNQLLRDFHSLIERTTGVGAKLAMKLDPALGWCRIDSTQFQAAVLNLVLNARDAVSAQGRITIETKNVELAPEAAEFEPGAYVVVAVRDDGHGIPSDLLPRVFDPFFTTKEVGKGSGLGLSQVYGFAKESGGDVNIYSAKDTGTIVRIYLPRVAAASESEPVAPAPAPVESARIAETVLVVEDNEPVLDMTVECLQDSGYRVLTAPNAAAALDILTGDKLIDILISDIVMPGGVDGLQLALEARQLRPTIRVLLTSGYPRQALAARHGLKVTMPFLGKPYSPKALNDAVFHLQRQARPEGPPSGDA
ncbi:MAG TPA: PAS domain S-box protein, partial [Candidatus Binataceae bacterium]|nr:PAS domain S-box protein [Candidatus Binataceae bacterium]